MKAKTVELRMYYKMEYVGFTSIKYNRDSIHHYVEVCDKISQDEEFDYDMIKVDDRFVLIPMYEDMVFVSSIDMNKSYVAFFGDDMIDFTEMYEDAKKQFEIEEKVMSDVEDLMTRTCDLCGESMHVTEIIFKNGNPKCNKCNNTIKL